MNWLVQKTAKTIGSGKLLVLAYHRIVSSFDPFLAGELDRDAFEMQIRQVSKYFDTPRLSDAIRDLSKNEPKDGAVCVTFDDGYADNVEVALPILRKYSVPATFFIATDYLNGGRMWNDTIIESIRNYEGSKLDLRHMGLGEFNSASTSQRVSLVKALIERVKYCPVDERQDIVNEIAVKTKVRLPNDLMMSTAQLRTLVRNGMEIGAHTRSHPILKELNADLARQEIVSSRQYLEKLLELRVRGFAYPNGVPGRDFTDTHVDMVREAGFEYAVTFGWGSASASTNNYRIPRIWTWDSSALKFLPRLMKVLASSNQ